MCRAEVSVNSVGSLLVAAGQWQQQDREECEQQRSFLQTIWEQKDGSLQILLRGHPGLARHPSHLTAVWSGQRLSAPGPGCRILRLLIDQDGTWTEASFSPAQHLLGAPLSNMLWLLDTSYFVLHV